MTKVSQNLLPEPEPVVNREIPVPTTPQLVQPKTPQLVQPTPSTPESPTFVTPPSTPEPIIPPRRSTQVRKQPERLNYEKF